MLQTKDSGIVLDVKAVGDDGVIEGYASAFGVVDSYNEVVEPGAFTASLVDARRKGRTVKMLWQHNPEQPIGVWEDIAEDSKGLYVKGRILKDASRLAAEAYNLLKGGALDELSIGYRTIQTTPDEDRNGILKLVKLDLREVSLVTFGALGRAARITDVKSDCNDLVLKLAAGDRLTEREWERLLKAEPFGLSNSQAERAVRINLKNGQGEPDVTAPDPEVMAFLAALRDAPTIDLTE